MQVHEAGISEGVRAVVGQRLHRLGAAVEQVLRTAAVIGCEFDVSLLADVLGVGVDGVLDALDAATAANLLIDVGADRHRFAHGLVRETLHARNSRRAVGAASIARWRWRSKLDTPGRSTTSPPISPQLDQATVSGDRGRAIELTVRARSWRRIVARPRTPLDGSAERSS